MTPGGFFHCLISSPFNSENICLISPTESDVLGRVMEGVLRGYFSKLIRPVRLEYPSGWFKKNLAFLCHLHSSPGVEAITVEDVNGVVGH